MKGRMYIKVPVIRDERWSGRFDDITIDYPGWMTKQALNEHLARYLARDDHDEVDP